MRKIIKEYITITFGLVFLSVGTYYFLVPANLATGGVSGIGIIIKQYYPSLPIGGMMMAMNVVLFIIAFLVIGSQFGAKTIYASFGLSGLIWALEKMFPISKPLTNDLFLNMVFGILLASIGMAIVFNCNASTGGTDIIGKILNKFFHIELGKAQLISDFSITLGATVVFGPTRGLYAVLGVIINGLMIDWVIEGLNIYIRVVIITDNSNDIKNFIIDDLKRGVTVYNAKGGFTGEEKIILNTILSRKEFIRLKAFVKELDKEAFITVSEVHEVLGHGFNKI